MTRTAPSPPCRRRASALSRAWTCSSGWKAEQPDAPSGLYRLRFPVGQALEYRYQLALIVLHFHGVGTELDVLRDFLGLSPERAGGPGFHERDAHVNGHGDVAV